MKALSSIPSVVVEHPENPEHGDYASPIVLGLAKQVGLPPMEVVATAAKHMPKKEYIIYRKNSCFTNFRLPA
jgi:arginyl-tRNA synthetase